MLKIRIVQILIDSEAWENRVCDDMTFASVLTSRLIFGPRGDNYASEPVATTSKIYEVVTVMLRDHGIRYEQLDISDDYELYVTSAPESYDYGYHIALGSMVAHDGVTERLIALQKERAEYQIGRNRSGLHYTRKVS